MFAIYDTDGRQFRDSLERLRAVRAIKGKPGIQLRPNIPEKGPQTVPSGADTETRGALPTNKALQTYRDMLQINRREPIFHAYQLMSHPVSTVRTEMDVLSAQRYFQEQGVRQMPVLTTQQRIVGMLSMMDLLQIIVTYSGQMRHLRGKCVTDAMSEEVITADPVSDIRRIAQVMHEYRLHCIPIVDELDALVGILSRSDILRAVINEPPLHMWT